MRAAAGKTPWRMTDGALLGLSWDTGDTALTIMNPAYGLYRAFGGKSATSHDEEAAPMAVHDFSASEGSRAVQSRVQAQAARGLSADKSRDESFRALSALRAQPVQSAAPIPVSVPSFALGGEHLGWSSLDTALSVLTFGASTPWSAMKEAGEHLRSGGTPASTVRDFTTTEGSRAIQSRVQGQGLRGAGAERQRAEALQALSALRGQPVQSAAPIQVTVPSFSLGEGGDADGPGVDGYEE